MAESVLVDNDVVLKVSSYALVDEAMAAMTVGGIPPAILGVGRFVIRGRLAKTRNLADAERARAQFERMLQTILLVEPDESEIALAAELEAEANRLDLELDSGESQLLAILSNRACRLLVTGDKRAIYAMAVFASSYTFARVACFEQLVTHIVGMIGADKVRLNVCSEPEADRALSICFSCNREPIPSDDALAALASYIRHLKGEAPGVLFPGYDFTALAA